MRLSGIFILFVGTTFAWFTSKDEVTNRLSANADYDVSIVESFAPPANWLPGQEVNKDVYAVNTGNVDAFVEETVSGTLTITKEVAKNALSADSIKLNKAERYVVEAGAYLAGAFDTNGAPLAGVELGNKVVSMVPDSANLDAYVENNTPLTDFDPVIPGLYVFRRSIGVNPDKTETFEYEGYYYDGQNFYKITDLSVVPDGASYAGDNDKTDGNLTGATFKFVEEETEVVNPVDLKYEAKGQNHPNRLVATYATGAAVTNGDLATLAKNYDDALEDLEDALERYSKASAASGTANQALLDANATLQQDLADLREKAKVLQNARDALQTARNNLAAKDAALTTARNNLTTAEQNAATAQATVNDKQRAVDEAQAAVDAKKAEIYGNADGGEGDLIDGTTVTDTDGNYTDSSLYGAWKAADTAKTNYTTTARQAFEAIFNEYVQTNSLTYVDDKGTEDTADDETKPLDLAHTSYDQLVNMNLGQNIGAQSTYADPTDDPRYKYYELVVAEKKAKEDLDYAKKQLTALNAAKSQADQQLAAAQSAKNTADGKVNEAKVALYGNADGGEGDLIDGTTVTATTGNYTEGSAYGQYKKALDDVNAANVVLYGNADGGEGDLIDGTTVTATTGNYTAGSAYGQWKEANDKVNDPTTGSQAAFNAAQGAVNNAGGTSADLKAAQDNLARAKQAKKEAEEAYTNATTANGGKLKININLSDDVTTAGGTADKWQLLPDGHLVDGDLGKTAYFYYTSILGAGETSSMLIDSVELDDSVTDDMFKRFDFDLNVGLKSAQIAMDSDGQTILTTAADSTLDATATLANPTSADTAITWAEKAAATPKKYKAAADKTTNGTDYNAVVGGVKINRLDTPVKIGDTYYQYEITESGDKYYGTALTATSEFTNATESGGVYTLVPAKKIKLTEAATVDNT